MTPKEAPPFTRYDLCRALAKKLNVPAEKAQEIVEEVLLQLSFALIEGRRIEFRGFGIFEVRTKKAMIVRNPKKPNVDYILPAHRVVRFKAGKVLAAELNPGGSDDSQSSDTSSPSPSEAASKAPSQAPV